MAHGALPSFNIGSGGPLDEMLWARQAEAFVHGIKVLTDVMAPAHHAVFDSITNPEYTSEHGAALGTLLNAYGSDKCHRHGYENLYASIMPQPDTDTVTDKDTDPDTVTVTDTVTDTPRSVSILEIGLGTNFADVPFTMGLSGKPGASLRAFRDFMPHAHIYGADIDVRILFQEERISTAHVDQLDAASLLSLPSRLGIEMFDVIIDDGLHALGANLNVIAYLLPHVKPGGHLIIEDVVIQSGKDGWLAIDAILKASKKYETKFIKAKIAHLYVIRVLISAGL